MEKPAKREKKTKLSNKAQFERFKETARKLEASESSEKFEEAFSKIIPAKPHRR